MSHRVTTETEVKDKQLAIAALNQANYTFKDEGTTLRVTSGPLRNSTIDLKTGRITGDTDYGHKDSLDSLGALKQAYGEAKYRKAVAQEGGSIVSRSVDVNGDVLLRVSVSFG